MEEILSSIKRIIAEEGEATPGRGRRAGRAAPPAPIDDPVDDEVLELSDPIPHERPARQDRPVEAVVAEPRAALPDPVEPAAAIRKPPRIDPQPAPAPAGNDAAAPEREPSRPEPAPLVSSGTVEATRGALDQLSRLLIKPEPGTDGTLEGMVREMLRPMLRDWLDASLPALVEQMVAREIEKIVCARR